MKTILWLLIFIFFLLSAGYIFYLSDYKYLISFNTSEQTKQSKPKPLPTPKYVKGIYLTASTFANNTQRNNLIKLSQESKINSFVIDIKDSAGKLMFAPNNKIIANYPTSKISIERKNYQDILQDLQNKNIYTIARITTFQDSTAASHFPHLALKNNSGGVWKNWQGIMWLDMTNPNSWDIPVAMAKEAKELGFDEIQFDYIRFPSDGNTSLISYYNKSDKKYIVLSEFYKYLKKELKDINIPLSIDLFGLTYKTRSNKEYDLNIGQRLIDAGKYFDYISPMVYPSHYPAGYMGFANPAQFPYEIVNSALADGNIILSSTSTPALTRPWLQDFDIGAVYDKDMVAKQIKACEDNNCSGWLLWNPRNIYSIP